MRLREPEEVVMTEVYERLRCAVSSTQRVELSPDDVVMIGVKLNSGGAVDDSMT